MTEVVIAGAAIVRDFHIFVARRSRPQAMSGYWELPGDELQGGEDEPSALQREFTREFGISLHTVDHILSDRRLQNWPSEEPDAAGTTATLRVWRCQIPREVYFDPSMGEPRPSLVSYDESRWLHIDDLDSVGPWRDADRLMADEIADYYRGDDTWQQAD